MITSTRRNVDIIMPHGIPIGYHMSGGFFIFKVKNGPMKSFHMAPPMGHHVAQ
jgi:hypothetical protein